MSSQIDVQKRPEEPSRSRSEFEEKSKKVLPFVVLKIIIAPFEEV